MNSKLYYQIISIKKIRAKLIETLKTNKKYKKMFLAFISITLLYFIIVFWGLRQSNNVLIVVISTIIYLRITFISFFNNPLSSTYVNATNLKRREKLRSLLVRYDITESNEIEQLDDLVNHWAIRIKPEKFNWAIILIFYSVIYTSFVNHLIKDVLTLIAFALLIHLSFIILKSLVELSVYGYYDSTYRFLLWVSEELKQLKLEKTLKDKNRN